MSKRKSKYVKKPEGWNKTYDDLYREIREGKREKIEQYEINWIFQNERNRILTSYRYPVKGDVYESKCDQKIEIVTDLSMRYGGCGIGMVTILKGERIWIDEEPEKRKPLSVYARPVNYNEFEKNNIPDEMKGSKIFGSSFFGHYCFNLSVETRILNENYKLVEVDYDWSKRINTTTIKNYADADKTSIDS